MSQNVLTTNSTHTILHELGDDDEGFGLGDDTEQLHEVRVAKLPADTFMYQLQWQYKQ